MIKIKIDVTRLDTKDRRDKLLHVAREMHQIMNSRIFMDSMMKIKKTGERSEWKNKSNAEIYKHIMSGSEVLTPEKDGVIEFAVDDFRQKFSRFRSMIVGFTYPKQDKIIRVNVKYLDNQPTVKIGSNQLHEIGHLLGFKHDFYATAERPNSICYQLNEVYEDCYRRIFNVQKKKKTVCRRSWKTLWLVKRCYTVEEWDL